MQFRDALRVVGATVWIGASEFVRNQILLRSYWTAHYAGLGLTFPEKPLNGAVWGLWSLFFALGIAAVAKKFSWLQTTFIAWWFGFVLMWVVIGNLGVLPVSILLFAVPLSLIEAAGAAWLVRGR
jgi:hypothetical protein